MKEGILDAHTAINAMKYSALSMVPNESLLNLSAHGNCTSAKNILRRRNAVRKKRCN